jgi:ribose 5-phosphate isomerase A
MCRVFICAGNNETLLLPLIIIYKCKDLLSAKEIKQKVATEAVNFIQQDMVIGIGSGSTVFYFIEELGKRIKNGLKITGVPTSQETLSLATERGINMISLNDLPSIDLVIDGADEIDPKLQLIKGGGAALLQEKIVANASKEVMIIADNSKLVSQLGKFPLPVEVIPYAWKPVQQQIQKQYCIRSSIRMKNDSPLVTDHGHYILDCYFEKIKDAPLLNVELHLIPGVVETGLFISLCHMALIGQPDGSIQTLRKA